MGYGLCTVIMPAYNAASFIDESIQSVLNQTYHNIEFLIIDDRIRNYLLLKMANSMTDVRFAGSQDSGVFLFGRHPFTVIKNAVEADTFKRSDIFRSTTRSRLGFDGKFVVGHVGRFAPVKNHEFLLDIIQKLIALRPDAILCLVGEGERKKTVVNEIVNRGLQNNVVLLDTCRNVAELYSSFDVFLLPSFYEGFGLVAVEAQYAGIHVIASKNRVPVESKISNYLEFLPLENSADAWVKKIIEVSKDNEPIVFEKEDYDIKIQAKGLEKPEALLVLGDTNSCLSVIAAKRLKIPVFHMEAGNRCFDENLPEEVNRRIVDVTSDVNLCYTEHARRYLNASGLAKERTYVVGSPMAEVLHKNIDSINNSKVLEKLGLQDGKYILLSAHREENIDIEENFFSLMNAVNYMAETYQIPVIYSTHPRSKKFIEARNFKFHPLVRTLQPFGFFDYNYLQQHAFCVVSDSGTIPEEASYFKFPAVSIRTSTERPEAIDKGIFVIGSIKKEQVVQAVELAVAMHLNHDDGVTVPDYADENVSTKVVKIIQSYTSIVNKMVWRKN